MVLNKVFICHSVSWTIKLLCLNDNTDDVHRSETVLPACWGYLITRFVHWVSCSRLHVVRQKALCARFSLRVRFFLHLYTFGPIPFNFLWGATLLFLSINRIFGPNVSSCLSLVSNFEFWLYQRGYLITRFVHWVSCSRLHEVRQKALAKSSLFPPSLPGGATLLFLSINRIFGPNVSSCSSLVSNFEFWLYQSK